MFGNIEYRKNEPLKMHSTFKIGGYARFFVLPKNHSELIYAINTCQKQNLKYYILGNGSNTLFPDNTFDGAIISLSKLKSISSRRYRESIIVTAESGTNLFSLNSYLLNNGISGLEWSFGIPGSVGGAVTMNAGAFGQCIGDYIQEITYLKNGKIHKSRKTRFAYRHCSLKNDAILSVKLKLKSGQKKQISHNMHVFLSKRKSSQPYNLPSIGSVFKRTPSQVPSKILDELGLKGLRVGDAMVSTKHAGFIVNMGNATSNDIKNLIKLIDEILHAKGYFFEKEIIILN